MQKIVANSSKKKKRVLPKKDRLHSCRDPVCSWARIAQFGQIGFHIPHTTYHIPFWRSHTGVHIPFFKSYFFQVIFLRFFKLFFCALHFFLENKNKITGSTVKVLNVIFQYFPLLSIYLITNGNLLHQQNSFQKQITEGIDLLKMLPLVRFFKLISIQYLSEQSNVYVMLFILK